MNLFLSLIITHLVTDFMLQFWGIGIHKRKLNKYMLGHIFITVLAYFLVCTLYKVSINSIVVTSLIIFITHLTIDVLRQEIHIKYQINPSQGRFWVFLGFDQILHIYFLSVCVKLML